MLGIHTTQAPRRKETTRPIYQEYKFVPYFQAVNIDNEDSYINECSEWIRNLATSVSRTEDKDDGILLLQNILKILNSDNLSLAQSTHQKEAQKAQCSNKNRILLQLLKEICTQNKDHWSTATLHVASSKHVTMEADDVLLGRLKQPDILKSFLLTANENRETQGNTQGKIKIVEFGDGHFYKLLLPWLQEQPLLGIDYIVVRAEDVYEDDLHGFEKDGKVSVCHWRGEGAVPGILRSSDLAVTDEIAFGENLPARLKTLSECITDGGFILMHGATTNHMLSLLARVLIGMPSACGWYQSLLSLQLYDEANVQDAIQSAGLKKVSHASTGSLNSMFLCRKLTVSSGSDPKLCEIDVSSLNPTWVDDVKSACGQDQKVWLKSLTGCNGVTGMMKSLQRESGGSNVR